MAKLLMLSKPWDSPISIFLFLLSVLSGSYLIQMDEAWKIYVENIQRHFTGSCCSNNIQCSKLLHDMTSYLNKKKKRATAKNTHCCDQWWSWQIRPICWFQYALTDQNHKKNISWGKIKKMSYCSINKKNRSR